MRGLSSQQIGVLGIVAEVGPVTPRDVGEYHLPIGVDAARGVLSRLERRKLVEATYTSHGGAGRAYVITERGTDALSIALSEERGG